MLEYLLCQQDLLLNCVYAAISQISTNHLMWVNYRFMDQKTKKMSTFLKL